ncbi:MAG: hypothetical protein ACI8V4_001210, partial [Ilumatobacter sp.]
GGWVGTVPVTCNVWEAPDTNGPAKPTSVRVSRMRVGVIATNADGLDDTALTSTRPSAPNVTATPALNATATPRNELVSWLSLSCAPSRGVPRPEAGHKTPTLPLSRRPITNSTPTDTTDRSTRPKAGMTRTCRRYSQSLNALAITRVTRPYVNAGQGQHKRCVTRH